MKLSSRPHVGNHTGPQRHRHGNTNGDAGHRNQHSSKKVLWMGNGWINSLQSDINIQILLWLCLILSFIKSYVMYKLSLKEDSRGPGIPGVSKGGKKLNCMAFLPYARHWTKFYFVSVILFKLDNPLTLLFLFIETEA